MYGKWIDQLCLSEDDFSFYRDEARKLGRLAGDYWKQFMSLPEGQAMIDGMTIPDDPMPSIGTHRQILEWLYRRADFVAQLEYRAGFDNTDGHIAAQIWNGNLHFIPPTEVHRYAA